MEELPKIKINNKTYYIDYKLRELRNIKNPKKEIKVVFDLRETVAGYLWDMGFVSSEIDSILKDKTNAELLQMKEGYEKGSQKIKKEFV